MRKIALVTLSLILVVGTAALKAQEGAQPAPPTKEHEWLKQLVGEWDTETEAIVEPGQPPVKCSGTEVVRSIGGYWTLAESNGKFLNVPVTGVLTIGYDTEKKKYVGTWIDSMTNYLWKYEGTVDADGKKLTLDTEGPCPGVPGKLSKFREVLELKSKDHKVFTSSILGDDGKWTTFVTSNYRRKS